jgi:aryl-alcohol dehydrogenase-like predicted oxidoreductase
MKERAQMERIDLHQAALRWLIDSAGVSRVLVGARTTDQLESTLSSFRVELDASLLFDLQTISDEVHRYLPESGNIFRYYP